VDIYDGIINEIAAQLYVILRRIQTQLKFTLRAPAQIRNPGIPLVFFKKHYEL